MISVLERLEGNHPGVTQAHSGRGLLPRLVTWCLTKCAVLFSSVHDGEQNAVLANAISKVV